MKEALFQMLTGAIGTLGFVMIAHIRTKHLAVASLGGFLGWMLFLPGYLMTQSVFLPNLFAAMAVYTWSEIMARTRKAPVTVFLVPGILPLLPGSFLYYTMQALMAEEMALFNHFATTTVAVTLGISCGIVGASVLFSYFIKTIARLKLAKTARNKRKTK